MIEFTVRMGAIYLNRDGSLWSELRAEKKFRKSEVWWDTLSDEIVVHTESQAYSDGDVGKRKGEHLAFLSREGWTCSVSW